MINLRVISALVLSCVLSACAVKNYSILNSSRYGDSEGWVPTFEIDQRLSFAVAIGVQKFGVHPSSYEWQSPAVDRKSLAYSDRQGHTNYASWLAKLLIYSYRPVSQEGKEVSYIARGVKIPFEQAIEAFVTRIYEIDDATTSFDQIAKLKTKYRSLSSNIFYPPQASL